MAFEVLSRCSDWLGIQNEHPSGTETACPWFLSRTLRQQAAERFAVQESSQQSPAVRAPAASLPRVKQILRFISVSAGYHLLTAGLSAVRDVVPVQPRRVLPAIGYAAFLLIRAWQVAASDSELWLPSINSCHSSDTSASAWALPLQLLDVAALGWVSVAFLAASPC